MTLRSSHGFLLSVCSTTCEQNGVSRSVQQRRAAVSSGWRHLLHALVDARHPDEDGRPQHGDVLDERLDVPLVEADARTCEV